MTAIWEQACRYQSRIEQAVALCKGFWWHQQIAVIARDRVIAVIGNLCARP